MAESMEARSSDQGGDDGGGLWLPPGFRFHPTDEEIITSYLVRKFLNPRSFVALAVGEVDLNSCEPRDLPSKSTMGEKEWYFFVHKDLKYPTGSRANRATREGYWKATGKDREIFKPTAAGDELVGMRKTLVFYTGRAPRGAKSDWVMHEFRLEGKSRDKIKNNPKRQDEWVVCKVFNKKGEAKTTTKSAAAADVECSYSAVTTPNDSSVVDGAGAGEGTGDFVDSMLTIDPLYFPNSDEYTSGQLPANAATTITTTNSNTNAAAPPYNADYYYSLPTTAVTFNAMPNYSLTNAPSNMQAVALATDTMASSVRAIRGNSIVGSSWQQHMLNTAPSHGIMGRSYDVNQDEQQAILMRALGGAMGFPNFVAPVGLPSAGVLPQQNKPGSYDGEFPYGNYDAATMNGQSSAASKNFGPRPY